MKSKPQHLPFLRATVTGLDSGATALALSCVLLTACASVGPDYRASCRRSTPAVAGFAAAFNPSPQT